MTLAHDHAIAAYRTAAAQVHPQVAVVRLYDVALRSLRQTVLFNRARRIEDTYVALNRTCQILRGLSSNIEGESEVADSLRKTYLANMLALHAAFGKPDAEHRYLTIAAGLVVLRNAWAELAGMAPARDLVAAVLTSNT